MDAEHGADNDVVGRKLAMMKPRMPTREHKFAAHVASMP